MKSRLVPLMNIQIGPRHWVSFRCCLSALSVDNGWSRLIILVLGDPHFLEGGERGQDRSSNPDGVFTLRGSDDLDRHGLRGKILEFLLKTSVNSLEHSGSSTHD